LDKETGEEQLLLRRETIDLERLSDLIFGLALSISALVLISQPPRNLQEILIDVVGFSYIFFILVVIWMRYSAALAFGESETPGQIRLNFAILFLVLLVPYFFFLLARGPTGFVDSRMNEVASILFALNLAAIMSILAIFSDQIAKCQKDRCHPGTSTRNSIYRVVFYSSAVILTVSTLPFILDLALFGIPLGYFFWTGPIILIMVGGWLTQRGFHYQF
jgi:uncharacterized membrane protein